MTTGGNPYPFGSTQWQEHNAKEISDRPQAHKGPRAPITPEEFESYRPKDAPKA
jgi:hypothetical protein